MVSPLSSAIRSGLYRWSCCLIFRCHRAFGSIAAQGVARPSQRADVEAVEGLEERRRGEWGEEF